jgi:hypothetical protein
MRAAAEEEQVAIVWRNRKSEMQRQQTRRRRRRRKPQTQNAAYKRTHESIEERKATLYGKTTYVFLYVHFITIRIGGYGKGMRYMYIYK